MSSPDWVRWYPSKWLSGVLHMNNEQRGAYAQIINVILDRGCCPDDEVYLARLCNCRRQAIRRLVSELACMGKVIRQDGFLFQERAHNERVEAAERTKTAAALAGKRWAKSRKINAIDDAAPQCKPQPHKKDSESLTYLPSLEPVPSEHDTNTVPSAVPKTRRRKDYPEPFNAFWAIYPKRSTDTKAGAFKAWDKARKAGTDLGALHEGALRYAAFVDRTGCETAHVQTWINREGWTASYASKGNGHANGTTNHRPSAIQDFWRRHAGPAGVGADTPDASDPPAGRG